MAIGPSFYAYSAATDIKEPVMYVNYATKRDFDYITRRGLNAFGKICIARIGQIPRREKVQNVEKAGGAGLLLFLDPEDVGPRTTREGPYPNSWWVGGSAMERGSVAYVLGDPLTPGYPSRDGMYRIPQSKASLPRIPCQPIGYDDARKILS
ncbi:N-acetylated-alpha-linked acidic dipeptidase 2-like [Ornithodoros turicata]|uniref:N-acetylated-alpha-linked acidic dipeptidase 2-like n=1 Tax=Ornithodoros turicata TaxID=34597 RepID=UPI003139F9DF